MRMPIIVVFSVLLCCCIHPVNTTIQSLCSSTPPFVFNLCNSTCAACQASDGNLCLSCSQPLVLDYAFYCQPPDNYTFVLKFADKTTYAQSDINMFQLQNSNSPLGISDITRICSPNEYLFDYVGFFKSTQTVVYTHTFPQTMSSFQIRMYVISLLLNSTIVITINDEEVLRGNLSNSINYSTTSDPVTPNSINYMQIPALNSQNYKTFFPISSTNWHYQQTKSISISFSVISPYSNNVDVWAFSDLEIIAIECNTCIKTATAHLIWWIGVLIGCMLAILLVLLLILHMLIQFEQSRNRKLQIAGNGGRYFPIEALNRLRLAEYRFRLSQKKAL